MHTHRSGQGGSQRGTIAIVGGESLLGKEVHELLESRKAPAILKLVAAMEVEDTPKGVASILTRGLEEPLVMASIELADLGSARVVILAGDKASSQKAYQKIRGDQPAPLGDRGPDPRSRRERRLWAGVRGPGALGLPGER